MIQTGPVQYLAETSQELCQRCKESRAVLIARKERFCPKCFIFFMKGKQRKQMLHERYKVKYGDSAERIGSQRVLLACSLGSSSVVLLDMLASLLREQTTTHNGRKGFELVVAHVAEGQEQLTESLRERYESLLAGIKVVQLDDFLDIPASIQKLLVAGNFTVVGTEAETGPLLSDILDKSANKSLRADLLEIVKRELIIRTAIAENCQTVLFGHSMTRLAHEVLALTVEGRGLAIHDSIADRSIDFQGQELHIIFPLREVLDAELKAVAKLSNLEDTLAVPPPKAKLTKNMTVQELASRYFELLDATGYSSTAATVVKTAEKLGAPHDEKSASCQVCGGNIHKDPREWLRNITVNDAAPLETDEEQNYAREYQLIADILGNPLAICYGCTVTMAGAGSGFAWPVRKQEILDEFVLTDDEG